MQTLLSRIVTTVQNLKLVKNHTHHNFEPKYLLDFEVLKILNNSTLLLIKPNGGKKKKKQVSMILNLAVQ